MWGFVLTWSGMFLWIYKTTPTGQAAHKPAGTREQLILGAKGVPPNTHTNHSAKGGFSAFKETSVQSFS